jgi:hypothetical protein
MSATRENEQAADGGPAQVRTRYVPSWLREQTAPAPTEATYGCGTEHKPGEFGMWGPVTEEIHALEVIGKTPEDVIIRFNADRTEDVLWRWDGGGWVLQVYANAVRPPPTPEPLF